MSLCAPSPGITWYVPNMDLRYPHKAELLHSLLVAVITVLPWQQGNLLIRIVSKNIYGKYEVRILSFGLVIAQFHGCHGNSTSKVSLKKVSAKLEKHISSYS